MTDLPKLTLPQGKSLLALVKFQEQQGKEIIFSVLGGWESEITPWDDIEQIVAKPSSETITIWSERGYISLGERGVGMGSSLPTLVLCQEALDYCDWVRKPSWLRWLIGQKDAWSSESKGVIAGVVSAILTLLIAKWLGF